MTESHYRHCYCAVCNRETAADGKTVEKARDLKPCFELSIGLTQSVDFKAMSVVVRNRLRSKTVRKEVYRDAQLVSVAAVRGCHRTRSLRRLICTTHTAAHGGIPTVGHWVAGSEMRACCSLRQCTDNESSIHRRLVQPDATHAGPAT